MNPTGMSAKVREELAALREENARLKETCVCSMCQAETRLQNGAWQVEKYEYECADFFWRRWFYGRDRSMRIRICPKCFKSKVIPFLQKECVFIDIQERDEL